MLRPLLLCLFLTACAERWTKDGIDQSGGCDTTVDCPKGFACEQHVCVHQPEPNPPAKPKAEKVSALNAPQCLLCTSDVQCSDDGSHGCWLSDSAGRFCGRDCTSDAKSCDPGSDCVLDEDGTYKTCVPKTGACPPAEQRLWAATGSTGLTGDTGATGTTGPTIPTGPVCGVDSWSNYASTFFADNCSSCHRFVKTHDGVKGRAEDIQAAIAEGSMPKGKTLSETEKSRILSWLSCGLTP